MHKTHVIFYTVKDPKTKIQVLLNIIDTHISSKQKIQILAPDIPSQIFVENLLWGHPKTAFRPHSKTNPSRFQDLIILSLFKEDPILYPFVFNLSQIPLDSNSEIKTLYELEDLTDPKKQESFQHKFSSYQNLGWTLTAKM